MSTAFYEVTYFPRIGAELVTVIDGRKSKPTTMWELQTLLRYCKDSYNSRGLKMERTDSHEDGLLVIRTQPIEV